MAEEENFQNILELLDNKSGLEQFCRVKPDYMSKPSSKMIYIFLGLFFSCFILAFLFILPFIDLLLAAILLSNYLYCLVNFIILTQIDPGYLKQDHKLLELLLKYESSNICPHCNIRKPPRSKHCDVCNTCIMVNCLFRCMTIIVSGSITV